MIQDPTHYQPHTYFHSKKTLKTHQINSFVQLFKGKKKEQYNKICWLTSEQRKKRKINQKLSIAPFSPFTSRTLGSLFLTFATLRFPCLLEDDQLSSLFQQEQMPTLFFLSVGSQRKIKTAASSISFFFEEVPQPL